MTPTAFVFTLCLVLLPHFVSAQKETTKLTVDQVNLLLPKIDSAAVEAKSKMHKDPASATILYQKIIDWVDSLPEGDISLKPYYLKQANAYRVLGSYAGMNDESVKALEYQEQSLNIKRKWGARESQILNYQAISANWGNSGDFEKAGIASDSAYRIALETNSSKHLSIAARGKAAFFMATQVNDSADYYYKIAIATADQAPSKVPKYAALDMYARFLREQGKTKESIPYVNQFLETLKSNKDTIFFTSVYLTLGESELAVGNPLKAIPFFNEGIYYAKKTNQKDELAQLYKGLAASYKGVKNYSKAFETHELYFEAYKRDRDTSAYRDRAEVALKNKYALQKAVDSTAFSQQKLLDESELKRKANTRFWLMVSGLLVVLGIIVFVYIRNRQKVKEQAYQNILLNKKVATKTEEINELLNETIQHIKSKEKIAENLQKLSKQEGDITLKSIIADINASKADNNKLILIKDNIEKVNYEFIKRLKQAHPQLTKTDIEICSFIRIGLSRKEVANLRNTSLEAVKSTRFRLKKKLELTSYTSLDNYINSL